MEKQLAADVSQTVAQECDTIHCDNPSEEQIDLYEKYGIVIPENIDKESHMIRHAEYELRRAGYFDEDADYGGMLGKSIMDLIKVFSCQGHSGYSASMTASLFKELAMFKTIGEFEPTIEESMLVHEDAAKGEKILQSLRKCSVFSNDGGKNWHDLDDKNWKFVNYTYTGEEIPGSKR